MFAWLCRAPLALVLLWSAAPAAAAVPPPVSPAAPPAAPAPTPAAPDRPAYNRHTGLFEPSFGELERAVKGGDRAEIGRWAARIGPARLAEAMRGPDRGRLLAAVEAVSLLPGSVRLLDAVTPLPGAHDATIAERAARAVARMLDTSEPRRLDDWDIPADVVARACRGLAETSARAAAGVEARLAALDALAEGGTWCKEVPLAALLNDASPDIRRAALLAVRYKDTAPTSALRQALGDPDRRVACAAAVAWCRIQRAPGPAGSPLRELILPDTAPVEDVMEVLPCLAISGDPADRKALEQIRRGRTPILRLRAGELLDPAGARAAGAK
jgi:hypothetical protein